MTIIPLNLDRFKKIPLEDFLVNLQLTRYKEIPPHIPTLPCETLGLMPAKQAFNDSLQGSIAAHLRCGGVVNNQIKIGFLLSL